MPNYTYSSCPQQIVCTRLPSRNTGAYFARLPFPRHFAVGLRIHEAFTKSNQRLQLCKSHGVLWPPGQNLPPTASAANGIFMDLVWNCLSHWQLAIGFIWFQALLFLVILCQCCHFYFEICETGFSWFERDVKQQSGKFCQVTFPTMANVGLSPMMCYKHPGRAQWQSDVWHRGVKMPGGQHHSLTKYSNTFCGSRDHVACSSRFRCVLLRKKRWKKWVWPSLWHSSGTSVIFMVLLFLYVTV